MEMFNEMFKIGNNKLYCENVELKYIAEKYGTPAYVYSKNYLIKKYSELHNALSPVEHEIFFAVKANGNLSVLKTFADLGCGFDVVSGGELFRALQAGANSKRIVFSGVGKSEQEIKFALEQKILCFNVESEAEIMRINEIAKKLSVVAMICLRVNPDVDAGTHENITTGTKEKKFGMDINTILNINMRKYTHTIVMGIHFHIGSQITELSHFKNALSVMKEFWKELKRCGHNLTVFNVGGGLGVKYDNEDVPGLKEYAKMLVDEVKELNMQLYVEPGRSLCGNAGALITRVEYIKNTPYKNFAIIDAAMNDLMRPALYKAYHKIIPIENHSVNAKIYDVVGPICESSDVMAYNRELPEIRQGDLLAVMGAGAYAASMSSNYNARLTIPEIMIDGYKDKLIKPRMSLEKLIEDEKLCMS